MPLSAGTCLGSYEIAALLGAAAMGEVFGGRDTELDWTVAINIPPRQNTTDTRLRDPLIPPIVLGDERFGTLRLDGEPRP